MPALRILIADDHEVVRHGVRALLEAHPGWEVCGDAANGRQAVEKTLHLRPDIVVLDIGMPELNGFDAARQIRKALPQCEVLILTMHESEEVVRETMAAGARGYVLKTDAGRDLVAAVDALRQHRPFVTSALSDLLTTGRPDHGHAGTTQSREGRLTVRERQVVEQLAHGKSNKEVATALGITVKTAETHRTNVMRKLGMHSVSELVRYAIRNRLVDP